MEQERKVFPADGHEVGVPPYMKEIIAELTQLARKSPDISQRSGVSVRVSICNYENLLSSAMRRSLRLGEREVCPRVSDMNSVVASTLGKVELEAVGDTKEDRLVDRLGQGGLVKSFKRYFMGEEVYELGRGVYKRLLGQGSHSMPSQGPGLPA